MQYTVFGYKKEVKQNYSSPTTFLNHNLKFLGGTILMLSFTLKSILVDE